MKDRYDAPDIDYERINFENQVRFYMHELKNIVHKRKTVYSTFDWSDRRRLQKRGIITYVNAGTTRYYYVTDRAKAVLRTLKEITL